MATQEILSAVQLLIEEAKTSGEKLNGTAIARRVGCGRTTLYTNSEVRELLLQAKIIEEPPADKLVQEKPKKKEQSVLERRLQKAEDRANRLEILLVQAQETIKAHEREIRKLRLQNELLSEGKSIV